MTPELLTKNQSAATPEDGSRRQPSDLICHSDDPHGLKESSSSSPFGADSAAVVEKGEGRKTGAGGRT